MDDRTHGFRGGFILPLLYIIISWPPNTIRKFLQALQATNSDFVLLSNSALLSRKPNSEMQKLEKGHNLPAESSWASR